MGEGRDCYAVVVYLFFIIIIIFAMILIFGLIWHLGHRIIFFLLGHRLGPKVVWLDRARGARQGEFEG